MCKLGRYAGSKGVQRPKVYAKPRVCRLFALIGVCSPESDLAQITFGAKSFHDSAIYCSQNWDLASHPSRTSGPCTSWITTCAFWTIALYTATSMARPATPHYPSLHNHISKAPASSPFGTRLSAVFRLVEAPKFLWPAGLSIKLLTLRVPGLSSPSQIALLKVIEIRNFETVNHLSSRISSWLEIWVNSLIVKHMRKDNDYLIKSFNCYSWSKESHTLKVVRAFTIIFRTCECRSFLFVFLNYSSSISNHCLTLTNNF